MATAFVPGQKPCYRPVNGYALLFTLDHLETELPDIWLAIESAVAGVLQEKKSALRKARRQAAKKRPKKTTTTEG